MPAQWIPSAWKALVARGEASGNPPGGYLPEKSGKKSKKHADCSTIIDQAMCDTLEGETQKLAQSFRGRNIDPMIITQMSIDGIPPGWTRIEKATFGKTLNRRRAEIYQAGYPGRWNAKLYNRRGKLYVHKGLPPAGMNLISAVQLAEDWLAVGPNFEPTLFKDPNSIARATSEINTAPRLSQSDPRTGETVMKTKSTIGRLIDRTLNAHQSVPPTPNPTPRPAPRRPEQPALTTRRAVDPASLKNVSAFVKRLLEPLQTDVANLRERDIGAIKGLSTTDLINKSITENHGITADGRMKPGAIVRSRMGLPYNGSPLQYVDSNGQAVEEVHNPRAKGQSISSMVRRSLGLQGDGRQPDSRSKFPSRYMPDVVFRSAQGRDQYDEQLSGNAHDGSVIVRAAQVNVGG